MNFRNISLIFTSIILIAFTGCSSTGIENLPSDSITFIDPIENSIVEGRVFIRMSMPYEYDDVYDVYVYANDDLLPSDVYFVHGDLHHWFFNSIGYDGLTTMTFEVRLNNGSIVSNSIDYNVIPREIVSYADDYDFITNHAILCSDVDSSNKMWFGSTDGLIRFDGNEFQQIGLFGQTIAALKVDQEDKIWILSPPNQLILFDNGVFSAYIITNGFEEPIIQRNMDRICINDDGEIYFTASKSLWKYDGNNFEKLNLYSVTHFNLDNNNELWFITKNGYSWYMNHLYENNVTSELIVFVHEDDLNFDLHGDLLIDDNNIKWFNIYNRLYKLENNIEEVFNVNLLRGDAWAFNIEMDSDGFIWLGTNRQGLEKIVSPSFYEYNETNCPIAGIGDRYCVPIQGLTIDKIGNIWFCTGDNIYGERGQIIQIKSTSYD